MAISREKDTVNIFAVLISQHRTVERLMEQIEAQCAESKKDARDLFAVMMTRLRAHAKAEEAVVYPRFAQIAELEEKMGHAREEHSEVEDLLDKMAMVGPEDPQFVAMLEELQENVGHHVQEEEGAIFPVAREHIDAVEAEGMAAQFLEEVHALTGERDSLDLPPPEEPKKLGFLARLLGRD